MSLLHSAHLRVRDDIVDLDGTPATGRFLERLRATNKTLLLCPMDNYDDNDDNNACRVDDGQATLTPVEGI